MERHLYQDAEFKTKHIAFLSLSWELAGCIPGFIDNMINHKVKQDTFEAHQIPKIWQLDPIEYRSEIGDLLRKNVSYQDIEKNSLTPDELTTARSVRTNLRCLSEEQISLLSRHAYNLTMLQVRLYCPEICHSISNDNSTD